MIVANNPPPSLSGMFRSTIRGGVTLDAVKSAMQKAIRRGDAQLAVDCLTRLLEVAHGADPAERIVKAIRTNILNRIRIIACEDVGLANINIITAAEKLELTDEAGAIELVTQAALGYHSRLASMMCAATRFQFLPDSIVDKYCLDEVKRALETDWALHRGRNQPLDAPVNKPSDMRRMWEEWYERCATDERKELVQSLYSIFRTLPPDKPEKKLPITLAILVSSGIIYRKASRNIPEIEPRDEFELPQYVLDVHTRVGRQKGADVNLFGREGSLVVNEWRPDTFLSQLYYTSKLELQEGLYNVSAGDILNRGVYTDVPDAYTDWPRGQLMTAKWKQSVFYDPNGLVWKGPYVREKVVGVMNERTKRIKELNLASIIPFLWLKGSDGYWLVSRNISPVPTNKWVIDEIYDKVLDRKVNIVRRESMGVTRLIDLEPKEQARLIYRHYNDFLILCAMGVGDMGSWNVLTIKRPTLDDTTDRMLFIIDWEDSTTKYKTVKEPNEESQEGDEEFKPHNVFVNRKLNPIMVVELTRLVEENGVGNVDLASIPDSPSKRAVERFIDTHHS